MRIRRKYPERTEIFTTVGMVLTFVTLRSKIHTLCLGHVYAEASVYAEDRERPREALGGGALTTWHPHPTPGSGPQGVGIHHPAQCPRWGRRCEAPGVPPPPGRGIRSTHTIQIWCEVKRYACVLRLIHSKICSK